LKLFSLALKEVKEETSFASGRSNILNMRAIDPYYYEMVKGLRAKVEYKMDTLNLRVLAVSSAVAGEGKTSTAIQLAVNMASTGRKNVLLLDMDLRKPSIAGEMGIASGPGLSEFLSGAVPKEMILRNSVVKGLSVIVGGKTIFSPADLLAGEMFRSLLREVREQFDLVILDTPPILPVPDAVTISEQVDAFILLFRFSHTPHQLFRQAIEDLGERKIVGVVLNGEEKKSNKYYHKYYGKYYQVTRSEGKRS
jgi:capsular exopolysaccharide synthesis family protein